MSKKDKITKTNYDLEFTISGLIPTSEADSGERRDGKEKAGVTEFRNALADSMLELARSKPEVFPIKKPDRIIVTIIQVIGKESVYVSGNDVDNTAKTILDLLQGPMFESDAQVQVLLASKVLEEGHKDIAYVGIKRIPTKTKYPDLLACGGIQHALDVCKHDGTISALVES